MNQISPDQLDQVSGGISQPIGIGGGTLPLDPVCELPYYPEPYPLPFPGPTNPQPVQPQPIQSQY